MLEEFFFLRPRQQAYPETTALPLTLRHLEVRKEDRESGKDKLERDISRRRTHQLPQHTNPPPRPRRRPETRYEPPHPTRLRRLCQLHLLLLHHGLHAADQHVGPADSLEDGVGGAVKVKGGDAAATRADAVVGGGVQG